MSAIQIGKFAFDAIKLAGICSNARNVLGIMTLNA